jgi:hypothetical protein
VKKCKSKDAKKAKKVVKKAAKKTDKLFGLPKDTPV